MGRSGNSAIPEGNRGNSQLCGAASDDSEGGMFRIGAFAPANSVLLAPMSGVSDLPFRRAAARAGAGMVVSEIVASDALARRRPDMVRRTEGDPAIRPFVIQIAGRDPHWMAQGARLAEAAGADIIDINMGCPARQVTGALCGSALMRDPDHALRLIEATLAATSRPVTVKMRLGWDRDCLNAPDLARRAESAGVAAVTVHARTRCQFFNGEADWAAVRAVKDSVRIPVVVNGDIADAEDVRLALQRSGADGVMIGRAAIGRPWLPGAIARALDAGSARIVSPPPDEECAAACAHYRDMISHYGTALGVRVARKHLAAYIDGAGVDIDPTLRRAFRAELCRVDDPAAVLDLLAGFYSGSARPGTMNRAA